MPADGDRDRRRAGDRLAHAERIALLAHALELGRQRGHVGLLVRREGLDEPQRAQAVVVV